MRRPAPDHRPDRGERGRVPPGPGAVHGVGSGGLGLGGGVLVGAALRVVRRFGAALRRRAASAVDRGLGRRLVRRAGLAGRPALRRCIGRRRRPSASRRRGRLARRPTLRRGRRRPRRPSRPAHCRRPRSAVVAALRVVRRFGAAGASSIDRGRRAPSVALGRLAGRPGREASPRARAGPRSTARLDERGAAVARAAGHRGAGHRAAGRTTGRRAAHRHGHPGRRSACPRRGGPAAHVRVAVDAATRRHRRSARDPWPTGRPHRPPRGPPRPPGHPGRHARPAPRRCSAIRYSGISGSSKSSSSASGLRFADDGAVGVPELRIPDRAERRRPRAARGGGGRVLRCSSSSSSSSSDANSGGDCRRSRRSPRSVRPRPGHVRGHGHGHRGVGGGAGRRLALAPRSRRSSARPGRRSWSRPGPARPSRRGRRG